MATRISTAAQNAAADAVANLVDASATLAGKIRIYGGASQPATANNSTAETLLAEFDCADPAFAASASGVATLSGTPLATTGAATGTATWFRLVDGDAVAGAAGIVDGSVTATGGGGQLELNTTSISTGVNVEITSGQVTMPAE